MKLSKIMVHTLDLKFLGLEQAVAAFLVETQEGVVLIETGPYSVHQELTKAIEKVGFKISDVKRVFLTHIHLDHAGGAWALAQQGAKVYVHPFGVRHLASPEKLMNSARRIYKDDMDRLWGDMKEIPAKQLVEVQHEEEINIGGVIFKAWHTPGHAIHHIAWQVGEVLFAGDVAGVKINNGMVVPPCPPPDINIEDWQNSIKIIKNIEVKKMFLTHFGAIENINEHLDNLNTCLQDWANWIKPRWENGEVASDLVPQFQEYVKQQLKDFGVPEEEFDAYEAANPSWMSVAGLMRYWKKKAEKE